MSDEQQEKPQEQQQQDTTTPTKPKLVEVKVLPNHPQFFAITIPNVFTLEECKELIDLSEKTGYSPALVNVGYGMQKLMTDIRNNDRCIIDTEEIADKIYQRIIDFVPQEFKSCRATCVNERLRWLRYTPGTEFKPHYDGAYFRDKNHPRPKERSYVTMQLYLNVVKEGGSTRFFPNPEDENDFIDVNPQPGTVILFQHNILHSGHPVTAGVKYVIRSDIMYDPIE